jgi:lipopolysaccharide transport system ATP-binding protein
MLPVIQVEDLSKAYQIGEFSTGTIAHDIRRWYIRMRGKEDPYLTIGEVNDRTVKGEGDVVWSLRDLNFEIAQGDAVGIIGRNGAGKSTLLKILSRITTPTIGKVKVKGRIASLLEVGTGFHPELTGRENVFLNGAILGMRKHEIKRKFDEIVDFSGVERYIDTPVKRYSSGMYVRLAFAVAAHLESEILIVDEVLAVGDTEFQKKCMGKMGEVSKGEGRTVLFVSHNMGSVSQLCSKAVFLNHGHLIDYDFTQRIVDLYIKSTSNSKEIYTNTAADKAMNIIDAFTTDENGIQSSTFTHLHKIIVVIKLFINKWVPYAELRLVLKDTNGKAIFTSDLKVNESDVGMSDSFQVMAEIPESFLRPGNFSITLATFVPHQLIIDLVVDAFSISIVDGGSEYAASEGMDYGYIFFDPVWKFSY